MEEPKKESSADKKAERSRRVTISVIVFILVLLIGWLYTPTSRKEGNRNNNSSVATVQPQKQMQGEITNFTPGNWVMVAKNYNPACRIDVTLLTKAPLVKCWARLDGERIVPLYACYPPESRHDEMSSEVSNLEVRKGFYTIEIMVDPGQDLSTFKALWVISPRRTRL